MPTFIKYIEAVNNLSKRSNRLANVECVRDEHGDLFYFAGSRSILFKVKHNDKYYSLKCYTSPNEFLKVRFDIFDAYVRDKNIDFIPRGSFFDDELKVFEREQSIQCPIVISQWIDGCTLASKIEKLCQIGDGEALFGLTHDLMKLFVELLSLELIHGDIKFDNILVDENGELFIIDWDGCYLNKLDICPTSEVGTVGFQHPLRTAEHYGFRVDDYSMALIVVRMILLAENPTLYFNSINKDIFLLSPIDIHQGKSRIYDKLLEAWRYYPLRYRLLTFLGGDKIELPDLRTILLRLSGGEIFNPDEEALIDSDTYSLRRIIDKSTRLYGFIDCGNRVVVDTMYGDATCFKNGIAGVRINADWFFIDRRGNQISELFSSIRDSDQGLFVVEKEGKWGYFDAEKFAITIPAIYDFAAPFINGVAKVSIDGVHYYNIDKFEKTI